MDIQTITAYNQDTDNIAALHSTLIPHKLYQLSELDSGVAVLRTLMSPCGTAMRQSF